MDFIQPALFRRPDRSRPPGGRRAAAVAVPRVVPAQNCRPGMIAVLAERRYNKR